MNSYLFHLTISDVTGFVFLILFPVYEKIKKQKKNYLILQVKLSICDNDCYNDGGWTRLFKEDKDSHKIIFL